MNKNLLISLALILLIAPRCFAKTQLPVCTQIGEIHCPKGFKPTCPKQYKPSCVFVGNMQLPACLADSYDDTAFDFHLDKISCQKGK
ncbi:MAG: hypothetical protein HYY52_07185 [Candidatus Melainabacteria bacterium]|nr:hypothetical protein [Candidatus Melainabacteria bacterium]